MLRYPRVRQHDVTDCAAACLQAVARFHGCPVPLARIREYASTDRSGTTVVGMLDAAERLGFSAKGVRAPLEAVAALPLPAIAHVATEAGVQHFVVLHAVRGARIVVMDPADGRIHRLHRADFAARWSGVLVLLTPGETLAGLRPPPTRAARFRRIVRPHRAVLTHALLGAIAYTLLGLSSAIFVQKVVDHVLIDANRNLLNLLGVAMLALLLARFALGIARNFLVLDTGQRIDAALVLGYYRHLFALPQRFVDRRRVGELVARVGDAVKIRAFVNDAAVDLLVNALVVVFSLALVFGYSVRLGLVAAALLPLHAAIYWAADRGNRRTLREVMERGAELEAHFVESLTTVSTIRRYGLIARTVRSAEASFVRLLRSVRGAAAIAIVSGASAELAGRLLGVGMLWIGALLVLEGALTPGQLMSCYALAMYLAAPAAALASSSGTVREAAIAADRLFEILDLEPEEDRPAAFAPAPVAGDIVLQRVRFRHGAGRWLFDGLDLRIPAGRVTVIRGGNGSGKSSLAAILQKIYPIQEGRVTIGGTDLRYLPAAALREAIVVVPQEVHLTSDTIAANLAMPDEEPDLGRILAIADELDLGAFVDRLPLGFLTPLGENGAGLSGGQRQRLAIGRALYRDPRVLILDEATSHLDVEGAACVRAVIRRLRAEGRTVVVITHGEDLLLEADQVISLEGGAARIPVPA